MTIIPAVIAWAFTLTFLIALALILLDVAGVRRIADAGQRKWLFRSLLGSVILAVVGFGTWQFQSSFRDPAEPAPPRQVVARSKESARPAPAQPPDPRPVEPAAETPTAPGEPPPQPAANPEVAAWAAENLGPRPDIPAAFDQTYPACVATLRTRPAAEIEQADASACRAQLIDHHTRYIVAFYRAKESYDRALRSQELALRRGGVQPDETARYNFVVAENEDFNDPGGPTLQRLEDADERIRRDRAACRSRRCGRE